MAFDPQDLSDVKGLNKGRTLHHYQTNDSMAAVLGAGYFNAAKDQLRSGDSILVTASDGEGIVRVPIVHGGQVVVVEVAKQNVSIPANALYSDSPEQTVTEALADLYDGGASDGSGVDLENALAAPTGFLGHDSEAGTVTPEAARTLLALVITAAGAPSTSAAFLGQIYVNSSNEDRYGAVDVGNGAADWELQSSLTLTANQYAAADSAGTAQEARTDKRAYTFAAPVTADGTYPLAMWPDIPVTLNEVSAATVGGTCSIKIQKGGVDINGFGSAVALTTTATDTASTETLAEGNKLTLVVSSASSLTGIYVTFKGTRTGA